MKRAALYARVSTGDQNEGMQLDEMRSDCTRRQFDVTEFTDAGISGAKERRPGLDRMLAEVRRGKFDVVMVYKFDRFARSLRHLIDALEEFRSRGVEFISVREQIDTTTPAGKLLFQMIGAFAEFEREVIRERVKSGIAHFRAKGNRWGRPEREADAVEIVRLRRQERLSWSQIAVRTGVSRSTCQRVAQKATEKELSK